MFDCAYIDLFLRLPRFGLLVKHGWTFLQIGCHEQVQVLSNEVIHFRLERGETDFITNV